MGFGSRNHVLLDMEHSPGQAAGTLGSPRVNVAQNHTMGGVSEIWREGHRFTLRCPRTRPKSPRPAAPGDRAQRALLSGACFSVEVGVSVTRTDCISFSGCSLEGVWMVFPALLALALHPPWINQ